MIGHILRKDLRLLWPMVVGLAAISLGNAVLLMHGGEFSRNAMLVGGGNFAWVSNAALPTVAVIALVLLVVSLVHQDPLPGTTQDWLIRPISRPQLWSAKLLFVWLFALVPIFIGDVAMGVSEHLDTVDVVAVSFSRSVALFGFLCVPAALIALVTRKLTDVLVIAIGLIVALVVALIACGLMEVQFLVVQSPYSWTVKWLFLVVAVVGLAVAVPLQLRWRSTHRVRWLLLIATCLSCMLFFMPYGMATWLQGIVDPPGRLAIDVKPDESVPMTYQQVGVDAARAKRVLLTVPLTVSGIDADEAIYLDHVAFRILSATGHELYRGNWSARASNVIVNAFNQPAGPGGSQRTEFQLQLPAAIFAEARSGHATVEARLTLTGYPRPGATLSGSALSPSAPTIDPSNGRMRCVASRNPYAKALAYTCESTRQIGQCFLAEPSTSDKSVRVAQCHTATYAPWPLAIWRDPYYSTIFFGADPNEKLGIPRHVDSDEAAAGIVVVGAFAPAIHEQRSTSFSMERAVERTAGNFARTVDGVGAAARFAHLSGAVTDHKGNIFVVDSLDSVVRKISPSGEVTTFAGSARLKGSTDGSNQDARFDRPSGIGIDATDTLFIADTGNGLIRKITPAGEVNTLAGPSADGKGTSSPIHFNNPTAVVPVAGGDLYVIDSAGPLKGTGPVIIRKVSSSGAVSILAGPDAATAQSDNGGVAIIEATGPD